MKFNEWINQKDIGAETGEPDDLLENQLDQWVNKLMGLLHTIPQDKKQKLLEKVISSLQASI